MANRIVLAGGSGFVGQALAASFLADGCEVHVLSRGSQSRSIQGRVVPWDGKTVGPWKDSLEDAAAVVNLTGRNINCRPTAANLREITASRVASAQAVGEAISQCRHPPRVFVQTSAVGIYGDAGDAICDESTPPGGGFLGETCKAWEKAFKEIDMPGVRRVVLRLGVVLGRTGGALSASGQARPMVSGRRRRQRTAIHQLAAPGRRRAALPRGDRSRRLARRLRGRRAAAGYQRRFHAGPARRAGRPWSPPVPALALRIGGWIMGINAGLVLAGQRCVPRRLMEQGFAFEFAELDAALRELVNER